MKIHPTSLKHLTASAALAAAVTLTTACSSHHGGGGGSPTPSPTPEPVEVVPEKPAAPVTAKHDPSTLTFTAVRLEFDGDYRVQKVERDAKGNYYVAITSDRVMTAEQRKTDKFASQDYAIMKFDSSGKEIWRFPTSKNASDEGTGIAGEKVGAYLVGSLADMHVTPAGDVYLIGLTVIENKIEATDIPNSNFDKIGWKSTYKTDPNPPKDIRFGNILFIRRITSNSSIANTPKSTRQLVAVPHWWRPLAINVEQDGGIVIESTSGSPAPTVGVTMQSQKFAADLHSMVSSACYLTQSAHPSAGTDHLLDIATTAPKALVDAMTAALAPVAVTADDNTANGVVKAELDKQAGRCWDLLETRVMPVGQDATYHILPATPADAILSRVDRMDDLLYGKNAFSDYVIDNDGVAGSSGWTFDLREARNLIMERSSAAGASQGGKLLRVGLEKKDAFGVSNLVIDNGIKTDADAWKGSLDCNSDRSPGSLDLFTSGANEVITAWTEVHRAGETNQFNRYLRIARFDRAGSAPDVPAIVDFEASDVGSGLFTFSSVRLADADNGRLAVFATAGQQDTGSVPETAKIASPMLIIGFTK